MIGENIRKFRDKLKMSQKDFAQALEISQTAVSQYELGQKQPSLRVINKILKFSKLKKIKIKLLDE